MLKNHIQFPISADAVCLLPIIIISGFGLFWIGTLFLFYKTIYFFSDVLIYYDPFGLASGEIISMFFVGRFIYIVFYVFISLIELKIYSIILYIIRAILFIQILAIIMIIFVN